MGRKLKIDSIKVTVPDKNGYVSIEVNKLGEPICYPVMIAYNQIMDSAIEKIVELVKDEYKLI